MSIPEVVASAIVAIAALAVTALVLCKIIDKAEPAPLDRCLREARGLAATLIKHR